MKASISHSELRTFRPIDRRTNSGFGSKLNNLWQTAIAYFSASSEPHIWKSADNGKIQWFAYDPINGQTVHYASEEEMRVWLEERHYRYGVSAS